MARNNVQGNEVYLRASAINYDLCSSIKEIYRATPKDKRHFRKPNFFARLQNLTFFVAFFGALNNSIDNDAQRTRKAFFTQNCK